MPQEDGVALAGALELRFLGLDVGDQGEVLRRVAALLHALVGRVRQDHHGGRRSTVVRADEEPGTLVPRR
ncbi:hypothetical protein AB0P40_33005 [Streptomyces sp. NPDC079189]|uniref:hypothetical protein n=1 Tax=unclassified Streptomyces TaxID=2593676 RepID=UPI0033B3EF92